MSVSRGNRCVAPPGLDPVFALYPGLTPWATFSTRLRRWAIKGTAIWIARVSNLRGFVEKPTTFSISPE